MIMQYSPGSFQTEKAEHGLVGYDKVTERESYYVAIPLDEVRRIVRFSKDDPEGYDSYEVSYEQVIQLLRSIHCDVFPPRDLEYFVEARALEAPLGR